MTNNYNRKVEYDIFWLGNGNSLDQSRIKQLTENKIGVTSFTDRALLQTAIKNKPPHLVVIANYADIKTNMDIGLSCKSNSSHKNLALMMITEFLDKETKEYYYQSGGNELVLEPASLIEIFFRIRHSKYIFDDKHNASIQIEEASQMALLAMENSSDLGSTINFVKAATHCSDYTTLARSILNAVKNYSDSAMLEMLGAESFYYFCSNGDIDPDLKKILLANKNKERIVRFDNAFQINHRHLVLLAEGLPVDDNARMGRIADNLAILADTADRFTSELLLREQAVVTELAKRRFISTISHELNTPMNAILGFSKMFSKRSENEILGKRGVISLNSIYNNSVKMKSIIETLIEITADEVGAASVGEVGLVKNPIKVQDLLLRLKNKTSLLAKKKALDLLFPSDNNLVFKSDQKHVSKMLFHLLDNAVKFTQQGEVKLTIEIQTDPYLGEMIAFSVSDSGIGINEANIGRLFNQLGQLDSSHDRQQYGAGLGLFYVQSYAKQLGGKISVESIEGKGSTFTLTLPTHKKK